MNNEETINLIKQKLSLAFHPEIINVIDESSKHRGHPGAREGQGHFKLEIKSSLFNNQSLVACHRQIYQVLDDLMQSKIHALTIKIL